MIEVEGLDEVLADLAEFGEELQETTTTSLNEIARALPNQLRAQIFAKKTNRTYGLSNSIDATVNNNKLTLEMKAYGYFQVFGVTGTKVAGFGLPLSVLQNLSSTPNGITNFKFNKIKHPGIFGVQSAADTISGLDDLIVNTLLED